MTLEQTNQALIAIIDDDELDHRIYKFSISQSCPQYIPLHFKSGAEALEYFSEHADDSAKLPDIVLLDIRMPGLNGWQYLEEFSALKNSLSKKNIGHYACTCSLNTEDINYQSKDLYGYYIKPILPVDIKEIVKNHNVACNAN